MNSRVTQYIKPNGKFSRKEYERRALLQLRLSQCLPGEGRGGQWPPLKDDGGRRERGRERDTERGR